MSRLARPASTSYRLRKYLLRHRLAASVAAMTVVLLAAFAIAQSIQLRRITRERDRADRISEFMTGMFKVSDPSELAATPSVPAKSWIRRRTRLAPACPRIPSCAPA
jgi:hypothetical protein